MTRNMLCILGVVLAGCSEVPSPLPPEQEPSPYVSFEQAPKEGAILDSANVFIAWKGGDAFSYQFAHRLDEEDWSDWTSDTSWRRLLDEGPHTFVLKGRYPPEGDYPGEESADLRCTFTVDAIHGPALWLKPRQADVRVGEIVTLSVMAEDMTDLMLAHLEVEFDGTRLSWVDAEEGPFFSRNDAEVVFLVKADQAQGRSILDLGAAGGKPYGVSGSGAIAVLEFRASARGTVEVTLTDSVKVRDSANRPLTLNTRERSFLIIQ